MLPYLHRHPPAQFWAFSLAETLEAREINGVDLYERGRLLVWVDDMFERVGAPADRTFGRARNLRLYFAVPEEFRGRPGGAARVFLVEFDKGGGDPRRHADLTRTTNLERILRMASQGGCSP